MTGRGWGSFVSDIVDHNLAVETNLGAELADPGVGLYRSWRKLGPPQVSSAISKLWSVTVPTEVCITTHSLQHTACCISQSVLLPVRHRSPTCRRSNIAIVDIAQTQCIAENHGIVENYITVFHAGVDEAFTVARCSTDSFSHVVARERAVH